MTDTVVSNQTLFFGIREGSIIDSDNPKMGPAPGPAIPNRESRGREPPAISVRMMMVDFNG